MSLFKGEKPHLGAYKVTPFSDDTETAITIIPADNQFTGKFIDCQNAAGTSLASIDASGNISGNNLTAIGSASLGGGIALGTGQISATNNSSLNAANASTTVGGIGTNGWLKVSVGGATRYIALGGNAT